MKSFKDLFKHNKYIDAKAVREAIDDGYVNVQYHPTKSLAILNYTKKTQFEQHWNEITCRCRGLVVEWDMFADKLRIVIESPRKFFNHDEEFAPDISEWKFDDMLVTEKLDGYYISARIDSKYGLIVTSRGSFNNQYVDAAKKLLPFANLKRDTNYFCELLKDFPGDEGIIVTRHPQEMVVCWGVNDKVPTESDRLGWPWPFHIAERVTQASLETYMQSEVEGVVIYNTKTRERIKFKTAWYLEMHRIISNCTFKRTLDIVSGGGQIENTTQTVYKDVNGEEHIVQVSAIPEEHYKQMCEWEEQIWAEFNRVSHLVAQDYLAYKDKTPKEYALESNSEAYVKGLVFKRFKGDGTDMDDAVWKVVRKLLSKSNNQ